MKKIFGGIDLTWKKLIIYAIVAGVYTAVMALIPITKDTSFRDIAIQFEWWILFGILIICNSKSSTDSALKCFVFFLISQPLVYLIQVPFSYMGWGLFKYYRYWFIWTLLCLPMGYIGYYIKKNNIFSLIIVLPMLILLAFLGLGYLNATIESFPHHFLSFLFCLAAIITIILNLFDKTKLRVLAFGVIALYVIGNIIVIRGLVNSEYEVVRSLNEYNLSGKVEVTSFSGTKNGDTKLIKLDDGYNIKLKGIKGGKYRFDLTDENNKLYSFEYYFDKKLKSVILKKVK